jgi:hypothetical protein
MWSGPPLCYAKLCWTYYTRQAPPLFAVLAHGMAAVAFWRTGLLLKRYVR